MTEPEKVARILAEELEMDESKIAEKKYKKSHPWRKSGQM